MAFGLAIGAAATGAALSGVGGFFQNRAIESGMRSARNAARIQMQQTVNAGELERRRIAQESQRALGSVRVAFAGAGVSGGSADALARQIALDAATDDLVVGTNTQNRVNRIRSSFEAETEAMASRTQPLLLSALQGAIGGFQTGLAIESGIRNLSGETA